MATDAEPLKTFIDASSPFNDPSADIIIRSSEGVDFRMYKVLLALASPFFKGMFELPQAMNNEERTGRVEPQDTRDGIPVISLYDDKNRICGKDVVEFVLGSCHPACLQSSNLQAPLSAEMVALIVDVAARYEVQWAVKTALRDPRLLETNPFLLFSISCQKGLAAEAMLAAQGTLRFRIADFPHEPALKLISGFQYHNLLEFHKRCGMAAKNVASEPGQAGQWMSRTVVMLLGWQHGPGKTNMTSSSTTSPNCGSENEWTSALFPTDFRSRFRINRQMCPQWWANYMRDTAVNLEARPHSSTVEDQSTIHRAIGDACDLCLRGNAYPLMKKFVPEFKAKVEETIRQISELPDSAMYLKIQEICE
ncbi:hypothetical protein DFH09DRAFT_1204069 [Mycena vulgaris]|nr:hypothetical protein DFH09DRAFT_1204069 [Mycena vulgaris]